MIKKMLDHLKALFAWSDVRRPWHVPLLASICVGTPALIGAATNQFSTAILSSLGALAILYMPNTRLMHRMVTLSLCSFGFIVCFSVASICNFNPFVAALALGVLSFSVIAITRYYCLPTPGSFFFIVIISLATYVPFKLHMLPFNIGMVALGSLLACLLAFLHGLFVGNSNLPSAAVQSDQHIHAIVLESALLAIFISGSYVVAILLELKNPYWVPISCAAILQGATYRMIWHRNIHRIVGTFIGMGLVWCVFSWDPNLWQLAIFITIFQWLIELLVVKNYGAAVIFITPLTVIMADASSSNLTTESLWQYRLLDISIGSIIGFLGGTVFHRTAFLKRIEMAWFPNKNSY